MRFDRLVLASMLALGLLVAALSVASARLGPTVDTVTIAQTLDGISVNTQIGVTFTAAMNRASVRRSFRIVPSVSGDFSWTGNQLLFSPRKPLQYNQTYRLVIESGATDTSGRRLLRSFRKTFRTQSEHLLYLATAGDNRNSLVLASVTGRQRLVGGGTGLITDFSLSFDRTLAVYVRRGDTRERPDEIWLVSMGDGSSRRIYRRPDWTITQPHFSPDGRYIVFLASNVRLCRPYYGCYRNRSGTIIELLDLRSRRVRPFRSASDVPITNFIDFSPAGQIAYTDLGSALTLAKPNGQGVVHVPNRGNSLEFTGFDSLGDKAVFVGQTPASTGGDILVYERGRYLDISRGVYDSSAPSFATDGKRIAYAAYRTEHNVEPVYGINVYTFASRKTERLTDEQVWSDWSPSWSPNNRYLAFVRSAPQEAMYMGAGEVWVIRSDGRDAHPLGGVGTNPQWVG